MKNTNTQNASNSSKIETIALMGLINSFSDRCKAEELGRADGLNRYRFDCRPVSGDWMVVSAVTLRQARSILFHELRRSLIED